MEYAQTVNNLNPQGQDMSLRAITYFFHTLFSGTPISPEKRAEIDRKFHENLFHEGWQEEAGLKDMFRQPLIDAGVEFKKATTGSSSQRPSDNQNTKQAKAYRPKKIL